MRLTLENFDPDALDARLIAECIGAAASVLAPDDNFDVVIAGDFVAAIRARTSDVRERESYDVDRTFGEAAARALTDLEPPTIVVNAGFVVKDADRDAARETFEHEALHVLTSRRGESLNDVRRRNRVTGVARSTFVAIAGVVAEEFRVVRALKTMHETLATDYKASLDEALTAFADAISSASDARHDGASVATYSESVMTTFLHLLTMLAYLAANEAPDFQSDSLLWNHWVAPTWPQLHGLLHRLPPATEEANSAELDALAFELADLLPDVLADIGFAVEDIDAEAGQVWFGPV